MKKITLIVIIGFFVLSGLEADATPLPKDTPISAASNTVTSQRLYGTSANWAGYVVETNLNAPQNHAVTDIKGSWTVPTVSGSMTPDAFSASWIGIDGYSSNTVEQIGTDSNVNHGVATYVAWYEMFPKPPVYLSMTIHAGDTMSAEVQYLGMSMFRLSITDVTTGESFSTVQITSDATSQLASKVISNDTEHVFVGDTQSLTVTKPTTTTAIGNSYRTVQYATIAPMTVASAEQGLLGVPQRSSAEWIIEAPVNQNGKILPLADFGTASFFNSQVTINGVTGSISNTHWQNDAITMQTSTSPPIVLAQPSALSPDGTSFTVAWHHQ